MQIQMQMQLAEMKEQGKQILKFLKAIAKQGKKRGSKVGISCRHCPLMTVMTVIRL